MDMKGRSVCWHEDDKGWSFGMERGGVFHIVGMRSGTFDGMD